MPTYVYACTECDHRFEVQQSFTDSALTQCPRCEGRLRKVFNSVGIVFKGTGFYRTDSRASSAAGANGKSDSRSESAANSQSDGAGTKSSNGASTKTTENGSSGSSSGSSGSSGSGKAASGSSSSSGSAA